MSIPDPRDPRVNEAINRYWRRNVAIMAVLLIVWAIAGLGAGVLFADTLNAWSLGGIPLGFWFAQQGSIIVFVVLILIYAVLLNRLDRQHHEDLGAILAADERGAA
jgi:putative solute:sodium symporter small subunit